MHPRGIVLPVSLGLVFGLLFAVSAQAQIAAPYTEYTAKFTCGKESPEETDDVVTGVYATSINIHNPQAKVTVPFIKKIVVALREGTGFVPPKVFRAFLRPDQADRVDCIFIAKALNLAAPYVEGVVVLEVPPVAGGQIRPVLDVIAKYTARGTTGGVSTQSVVPVVGKDITN
jgi:hypothetical protein